MQAILGIQSHFSFHWGTASPTDWFVRAHELGYAYLGIADSAALHGLPEIVKLSAKKPVKPLYGATFHYGDAHSAIVYIRTPQGYGNLCQRISEWQRQCDAHPEPRAGGLPLLGTARAHGLFGDTRLLDGLVFIVDDAELWRTLHRAGAETYWRIGPTLAAPPRGIPLDAIVFAPGPFMLAPGDFDTHRLLRAVGGADTLDRMPTAERYSELRGGAPVRIGTPEGWLRSPGRYAETFGLYADAIERADALAEKLSEFIPCQNTLHPPEPDDHDTVPGTGETALVRLRRLAYDVAKIRYGAINRAVRDRLEKELGLIRRKGFAEYFLVVHDIVARLAGGDGRVRRGRSVTCGRGSGAASLVNYCLGVTNVDAVKHDLMFERFLNEVRFDPPDIDVDFAWDERDDLLDKVLASYGSDRVGRVANHNRYDWRGAFRAAARTRGFSDPEITRHMRESPSVYADPDPGDTPPPDVERLPAVDRTTRKLAVLRRTDRADWNEVGVLARRLMGKPHGLSMHCGGVIISPGTLCRSVPTIVSRKGQPTIQWEKDGAEDMGLVKIDLLGNRSLAVIRDAIQAIARDTGVAEDNVIKDDPTEDAATRDLVRRGDTFGVFYFESPSMRLLMAKAQKDDFKHAVIHSSIIRPAANAFINEYLERARNGKDRKSTESEYFKDLFDESYGIPVYQEDVVKLAMALCDYDYARADGIRKCLGKRDAYARLTEEFQDMKAAARAKRVDEETIQGFWRTLMSMTGYSFCKPHSASYAQVSFEAAYLRAHYPAYFISAVLSNGGGYYTVQSYVSEAMRMGLRVLGPDVNASGIKWRAEGKGAVRTGLMTLSGLSRSAMRTIVDERERGGRYTGLEDFFLRVRIHADDLRRLALVGGLDSLAPDLNRPQILWCTARGAEAGAMEPAAVGISANGSLFAQRPTRPALPHVEMLAPLPEYLRPPPLSDYTKRQRLEAEYDTLGFLPGFHPMALYEDEIRESARVFRGRTNPIPTRAGRIHRHVGRLVTILAWPVTAKLVETKHGDAMMFQSFEDDEALCEAVVFPEEFRRYHRLLGTVQPLWVTGKVLEEFGVASLQVLAV